MHISITSRYSCTIELRINHSFCMRVFECIPNLCSVNRCWTFISVIFISTLVAIPFTFLVQLHFFLYLFFNILNLFGISDVWGCLKRRLQSLQSCLSTCFVPYNNNKKSNDHNSILEDLFHENYNSYTRHLIIWLCV